LTPFIASSTVGGGVGGAAAAAASCATAGTVHIARTATINNSHTLDRRLHRPPRAMLQRIRHLPLKKRANTRIEPRTSRRGAVALPDSARRHSAARHHMCAAAELPTQRLP